jgi:hypothetical protein
MNYLARSSDIRDDKLMEEIVDGLVKTAVHYRIVEDSDGGRKRAQLEPEECAELLKREVFRGAGAGTS